LRFSHFALRFVSEINASITDSHIFRST